MGCTSDKQELREAEHGAQNRGPQEHLAQGNLFQKGVVGADARQAGKRAHKAHAAHELGVEAKAVGFKEEHCCV